jgi:hypothetical protein
MSSSNIKYKHENKPVVGFAVRLLYSTINLYLHVNLPIPSIIDTANVWLHKTNNQDTIIKQTIEITKTLLDQNYSQCTITTTNLQQV